VVEGHGFREKGIVVYGFGGSVNDFSHVRFPGILNDCSACHLSGTYELAGRWVEPSQGGGILGSTVNTSALTSDASDDLKISPTGAVCSSCHDSASAQDHMVTQGNAIGIGSSLPDTQANLSLNYETCSICHGPGRVADVKVVHGVK
jgi:OmcA/MtrC family decaheme c-type cytochrome